MNETLIRAFEQEDLDYLVSMHREMGMTYPFPDLYRTNPDGTQGEENPLFVRKLVMEVNGKPAMAMLARMTTEGYLLQDVAASPEVRWERFKLMQKALFDGLWKAGFEDIHAFLPPNLDMPFGRRLISTGWIREKWPAYCKYLESPRGV